MDPALHQSELDASDLAELHDLFADILTIAKTPQIGEFFSCIKVVSVDDQM